MWWCITRIRSTIFITDRRCCWSTVAVILSTVAVGTKSSLFQVVSWLQKQEVARLRPISKNWEVREGIVGGCDVQYVGQNQLLALLIPNLPTPAR